MIWCSFSLAMSAVCLMGFDALTPKFNEICARLHAMHFDRCDYAAFKVLTLFEDQGYILRSSPIKEIVHREINTIFIHLKD